MASIHHNEQISLGGLIQYPAESDATGTWQQDNLIPPTGQLPSERGAIEDIHTALGVGGMIPGVGIIPDLIDAGLYGAEGDYSGSLLSLLAATPLLGLAAGGIKTVARKGTKKLYRGVTDWHRGKMVKEGAHVSPKDMDAGMGVTTGTNPTETGIWATPDRDQALSYIEDDFLENPQLLEYEVPEEWFEEKAAKQFEDYGKGLLDYVPDSDWIEGGIPKQYFKKRHKLKQGWKSEYFPPFEDMDW